MSSSSSENEILIHSKLDNWDSSVESIFSQKIAKLTKSESLFDEFSKLSPSLTISEIELREIRLNSFKETPPQWEFIREKPRIPKLTQTRSVLKDELDILKINMSMQDKISAFRRSQFLTGRKISTKKQKRAKKVLKFLYKHSFLNKCLTSVKNKDLFTEIEESDCAKTDKVAWKFLKRGPSFRRDYINARKLILEIQTLDLPGLRFFDSKTDSRFQNTQPIKTTCPNCMFYVTTHVKKVSSIRTKFLSFLLTIIGLCIVPHVFYAFKDTVHLCPLCKIYLGFCPAFNIRSKKIRNKIFESESESFINKEVFDIDDMVSASSTSAKNLFVESKLRLSDRVQVNVNNIAAIARQIQRGSKSNENLINAAKNFALQEAAIENSETNLKKLRLLTTHINNQLDVLHSNSSKMELVLEQVRSMQR